MTKAVRVHQVGGPEVLTYEDVDVPPPGHGEVRIRQHAIGLNFIDTYYRSGLYKAPALPFIAGNEAFIASGCQNPPDVCPRSAEELNFANVMVMADDPKLRNNRIALLKELHDMMNQVADISKLAS